MVVRANFGPEDEELIRDLVPPPSAQNTETIDEKDADLTLRRRFTVGVPSKSGAHAGAVGVIAMNRSARGRPFTEADRELFRGVTASWECCGALFCGKHEGARHVYAAPLHLVGSRLREGVSELRKEFPACEGSIFVHGDKAQRRLFRYVFYPHSWVPGDIRYEPTGHFGAGVARGRSDAITVQSAKTSDGKTQARICVPLSAWIESHYMRAIFVLDLGAQLENAKDHLPKVLETAVATGVYFSKNLWQLGGAFDGDLPGEFVKYVRRDVDNVCRGREPRLIQGRTIPADVPEYLSCLDPELRASKVRLTKDGSDCLIPLSVGPVEAAWLLCPLAEDLKEKLGRAMGQGRPRRPARTGRTQDAGRESVGEGAARQLRQEEEGAWRKLRQTVGLVTGAWTRVVVAYKHLWLYIEFTPERADGETRVWKATLHWPGPGQESRP